MNWIELNESEDLTHLSRTGEICERADSVYFKMLDELTDTFGISEDIILLQRNKIRIEEMYYKQTKTGDMSNQLFIDILEIKNQGLKSKHKKSDLFEAVANIEKSQNVSKSVIELTVWEFYKYVNLISKRKPNG